MRNYLNDKIIKPSNIYGKVILSGGEIKNHKQNDSWMLEKHIEDSCNILKDVEAVLKAMIQD